MDKPYDKIIKDNIAALFLPLAEKYLHLKIVHAEDMATKIQFIQEREPDFLKKITTADNQQMILHLEFQTRMEKDMVYRMAEYKAVLQRKYKLAVKQFVIYFGKGKTRTRTKLHPEEIIDGYELKNIWLMNTRDFLDAEIPEELLLAILADYPKANAGQVIKEILIKLQRIVDNPAILQKYLQQLTILSRLRNLAEQTKTEIQQMPITFNIKEDIFYKEGKQEGKQEGVNMVFEVKRMVDQGYTVEQIHQTTGLPKEIILRIQNL